MSKTPRKPGTLAGHLGRTPGKWLGAVNTPVFRASTILFPTVAALKAAADGKYPGLTYALHGVPTVTDLQAAIAELEGGHAALAVPSGLTATTLPLLALLKPGDHLLVTDSVYGPTRRFCDLHLARMGVGVTYYDPLLGADIAREFRPETRVVFVESPGSLTFDVQDVPAIAAVAHARGAVVVMDNTWATPLYFRAFDHGVDVSVHAATKYIGGHSDVLLGLIVGNAATYPALHRLWTDMGVTASSDDCFLGLRGLRTLPIAPRAAAGERLARSRSGCARGPRSRKCCIPGLPGARGHDAVEARLPRRVVAVRRRAAPGRGGAHRRDARRSRTLLDGLELGRLREPRHPHVARAHAYRDHVESGRAVPALRDRARGSRTISSPTWTQASRDCAVESACVRSGAPRAAVSAPPAVRH